MAHPPSDIMWTKATSKNGVPFEFGVRKTKDQIPTVKGGGGTVAVNWPVGDDTWKPVTNVLGISQYKVHDNRPSVYDYRLEFINTATWDFKFWDEAGDSYRVNTYSIGDHFVRYNSNQPTIKIVESTS